METTGSNTAELTSTDVSHLEIVETHSFQPIGWLWKSVYEQLRMRGLVEYTRQGGFILSDDGARALARFRAGGAT